MAAKQDAPKTGHEVNTAAVNKSIDEWRASQGLPPVDRSKEARKEGK